MGYSDKNGAVLITGLTSTAILIISTATLILMAMSTAMIIRPMRTAMPMLMGPSIATSSLAAQNFQYTLFIYLYYKLKNWK